MTAASSAPRARRLSFVVTVADLPVHDIPGRPPVGLTDTNYTYMT
jgi:hypothetical protein